ncbi:MAG TPA: hypothetical protein DIW37_08140, partial [Chryseobacterium sp.]|nr:hypothetical protein [Chryseobacterium sp.]
KAIKATKKLSKNSRRIITKEFTTKENLLQSITEVNTDLELNYTDFSSKKETEDKMTHTDKLNLKPFENLDDEAFDS